MKIKINKNLYISPNSRPLLIAEISANHGGSKKKFLKHIIEAKKSGADLVKIQTYQPNDMIIDKKFQIKKGLWKNKNLWRLYEEAKTPYDWHHDAFKIAKKKNIELFSTPFSINSFNFLKKFKPNLYKIASFELTDLNLIDHVAKEKKPIIISTGLSSIAEIKNAVKQIRKYHNKIIVMYCVSSYPALNIEIDFSRIKKLKKILNIKNIGFSDHTNGILAPTLSLAHGVCAIEKHFKISDKTKSHDSKFSLNAKKFKELSNNVKNSFIIYNRHKKLEDKNSLFFRRSIYAIKNIKKGDYFTKENIGCFRPFTGLCASKFMKIIGKKSSRNFKSGKVLS